MFNNIEITAGDILLSGGAQGADAAFGEAAITAGHQVVHWSFNGHKTNVDHVYMLNDEQLHAADPHINIANKSLLRTFPSKKDYTNNLIRRNYYQVKWCESVYAISSFKNDSSMLKVDGGTAWAVQMYVDRFLFDQEPFKLCKLYLFDQKSNEWYQWNKIWTRIDKPPRPDGVYAGIGTRELTDAGLAAINSLYATDAKA